MRGRGLALRAACDACEGAPIRGQQRLRPGDVLVLEGTPAEQVFPVVAGFLKESRHLSDGRSVTVRLVRPGDVVGTEALLGGEYDSTIEALTEARVCCVPASQASATLSAHADRSRALELLREERLSEMRDRFVLTGALEADERVLEILRQFGEAYAPGAWLRLPFSRNQLADLLGLAVETVSRSIGHLRDRGALEVRGRSVRLAT